jgi:hypothetical protein
VAVTFVRAVGTKSSRGARFSTVFSSPASRTPKNTDYVIKTGVTCTNFCVFMFQKAKKSDEIII